VVHGESELGSFRAAPTTGHGGSAGIAVGTVDGEDLQFTENTDILKPAMPVVDGGLVFGGELVAELRDDELQFRCRGCGQGHFGFCVGGGGELAACRNAFGLSCCSVSSHAHCVCGTRAATPATPDAAHMAGMETLFNLGIVPEDVKQVLKAGDWHGNTRWMRQVLTFAARDGYKAIVHVGDLKVLWPDEFYPDFAESGGFTAELVQLLDELGLVFIFIDGNHDAHPALRNLPLNTDGFGVISDRLLYAPRGHRWNIGGVRFGALGGAYSIDRARGTEGWDWFLDEAVVPEDVVALGSEALDVLVTHDVPAGIDLDMGLMEIPEAIERESYIVRSLLRDAVRAMEPKLVFSGHWHQRRTGLMPGLETRVHVLDREFSGGNIVSLDLQTLAVEEYKPV